MGKIVKRIELALIPIAGVIALVIQPLFPSISHSLGILSIALASDNNPYTLTCDYNTDWGFPIEIEETDEYVSLDNGTFRTEFYKGTVGYDTIYDANGDLLVDQIWTEIQYQRPNGQWRLRGDTIDISYEKIDDYHYSVTRYYDDYNGTTAEATYLVTSDEATKLTVTINSGATDNYRILWSLDGIAQNEENPVTYGYLWGDPQVEDNWLEIGWEDVYLSFGDITTTETDTSAQGRKADIYFTVGEILEGQQLVIDPEYNGRIKTDREKLDATESLIQDYIDYYNEVLRDYHLDLYSFEQWYIFSQRTILYGGNVFNQYFLPLLSERNALRDIVLDSYCTENEIIWSNLTDEQRFELDPIIYGDKAQLRELDTKATVVLFNKMVSVDVSSLSGELPPDPYENIEDDYTEVDASSDLTITDELIEVDTMYTAISTYVYKDHGTDHFDDVTHRITVEMVEQEHPDAWLGVWMISDSAGTHADHQSANEGVAVHYYYNRWYIVDYSDDSSDAYIFTFSNRTFYLEPDRTGTTVLCKIYDDDGDPFEGTLLDTITTGCDTDPYDYVQPCFSKEGGGNKYITADIYNLDLQEASEPDISNTPSTWVMGTVAPNTTYWSSGSEPSWPLTDGDAYFTVTNNSGFAVDINIKGSNFTGGVGWTLAGSPAENTVQIVAFEEGDGSGDGLTLTTSDQLLMNALADSGDKDWELKLLSSTSHTDAVAKTGTVTITAVAD